MKWDVGEEEMCLAATSITVLGLLLNPLNSLSKC